MKMYYITLNSHEKARIISQALLENRLVACTNWFPITSMYPFEGKIREETEVVLIAKTRAGMRTAIEKVISQHINYTNYIAELDVNSVNEQYLKWLETEIPPG